MVINMKNNKTSKTFRVEICIAGDYNDAKKICKGFANTVGICVTVTRAEYIYTGGCEDGVIVRMINYPKYPADKEDIRGKAYILGIALTQGLFQDSFTIVDDEKTEWYSNRDH
jgi:hypothetical protein